MDGTPKERSTSSHTPSPDQGSRQLHGLDFGAAADRYTRLRPAPSAAVLRWGVRGTETDVLDLAAGTGQVTSALLDPASQVFSAPPHLSAVEPDGRMRELLSNRFAGLSIHAGTAESIPAPSSSQDAVLVGSAWHWFDESAALVELARVLRPGGRLCVLGTSPDITVDWVKELYSDLGLARLERHAEAYSRHGKPHPGFDGLAQARFHTTTTVSRAGIIDSFTTHSVYLEADEQGRRMILQHVTDKLDASCSGATSIDFPLRTLAFSMTRRSDDV